MAKLKAIYAKKEDIPEGFDELYSERNGQFELTQVEGVKTQADIDRVSEGLRKEKAEHKQTKEKLAAFGELDPATVPAQLEELAEVKAQLATVTKDGKVNQEAVQQQIDAAVNRAVGPLNRDNKALQAQLSAKDKALGERDTEIGGLKAGILTKEIEGTLRDAAIGEKVLSTAIDDAVLVGSRVFERTESGAIVTRDGLGYTPGLTPKEWLKDMQEKRPHWWPASQGGGAGGGRGDPGTGKGNPWSKEAWNVTAQGAYVRQHGEAKAREAAERVGSALGATKPPAPKAA